MENYIIKDSDGNIISAKLIVSFFSNETKKNYIALDTNNSIFSPDSSYNNLDIFEITKEDNNIFYVSDIPNIEWELVKNTMIKEIFSKII